MAVVTMRNLLESGVHFGHQTRRWDPKMKRYIFTERNGIYIIDLQKTLTYIDSAYAFVKNTVARGGSVLFIGTKKQAQEAIEEQAKRVGMPYVTHRWLGGMLTNFQTVHKRLQRLKELEEIGSAGAEGSVRTKKERLILDRERSKLDRTLGGIRDMARLPDAVWVVDTKKEHIAVDEAKKLGIPVVAILDTNCDPDLVDFPIPGNDDAIRAVGLLTRVVADAVADGLIARSAASEGEEPRGTAAADEPLAEWERELLQSSQAEAGQNGNGSGRTVAAATEAPVTEVPAAEASAAEASATEAPATDAPVAEAPVAETPVAEAPAVETPVAETPAAEAPVAETPAAEAPAAETPAAEELAAETPAAEAPAAETAPTEESAATDAPAPDAAPAADPGTEQS
ncbi:MAG: 30S ribosomal protein S2 [Streptosporangiales bacterium]|nr:30S ribosomal protein S2 [Streptosporangiales bacterium]